MIHRLALVSVSTVLLTSSVAAADGDAPSGGHAQRCIAACSSGARTLSHPGDHVYPDMGNGGYISLHTDVHLVYAAPSNRFLPGNHVVLTDRATQCLSDFSLDLERSNADAADGPDLTVQAVTVNGVAAVVPVRPADLPRRPERPGRPGPAGPPGLAGHAGRRSRLQPAPAGLLAAGHRQRRQRPERRALPGQQARDHARRSRCPTATVFRVSVAYTGRPAYTSTATARPRAGSGPTSPPATAGS